MRQRNDQPHPLIVHTDPPQFVEPGAVIEHDDLVVGLTVVDDPTPAADDPPAAGGKPTRASKEAMR